MVVMIILTFIRNTRVPASCLQFLLSVNQKFSKREHNYVMNIIKTILTFIRKNKECQ